jgi:hypothetical protein
MPCCTPSGRKYPVAGTSSLSAADANARFQPQSKILREGPARQNGTITQLHNPQELFFFGPLLQ